MSDKIGKDEYDESELITERKLAEKEFFEEIEKNKNSVRIDGLMITNYIDSTLKDCVELLFRSKAARGISRKVILEILKEKNIIDNIVFEDLKKINQIRDQYGHTIRMTIIRERVIKIVEKTNVLVGLKIIHTDWDKLTPDQKIIAFTTEAYKEVNNIFSSIVTMKNNR